MNKVKELSVHDLSMIMDLSTCQVTYYHSIISQCRSIIVATRTMIILILILTMILIRCDITFGGFFVCVIAAGDLLREERNRPGSKVGELINSYIKEGQIVPMEITIKLLDTAMLQSGGNRFLIDGFPRKMDQAHKFEETVSTFYKNLTSSEQYVEQLADSFGVFLKIMVLWMHYSLHENLKMIGGQKIFFI